MAKNYSHGPHASLCALLMMVVCLCSGTRVDAEAPHSSVKEPAYLSFNAKLGETYTYKKPVTHFFAGESVQQTFILDAIPDGADPGELSWRLMALNAPVAQGRSDMVEAVDGHWECEISFTLPDLTRRTPMRLLAHMTSGEGETALLDKTIVVYPREGTLSTASIKGKRVGVIDTDNSLIKILESLGVETEKILGVDWISSFDGDGVIIGTYAFGRFEAQAHFYDSLAETRYNCPILIFSQMTSEIVFSDDPDQFDEIVAPGHGVFYTLGNEDFRGWQPNGILGTPQSLFYDRGAFRALLSDGTRVTISQAAHIQEQITPSRNHVYWCNLPLVACWEREPVCRMLMINLLTQMVDPASRISLVRRTPAIYGDVGNKWLSATACELAGLDPRHDDPPIDNALPLATARLAILDAGSESIKRITDAQPDFFESLEAWVRQGGIVFVSGLGEDDAGLFEWALGDRPRIEVCESPALRKTDPANPLLWGFSSRDLTAFVERSPSINTITPDPMPEGWETLVDPPVFTRLEVGKGSIVFCGFNPPCLDLFIRQFWIPLLMNQGIMIEPLNNN